MCVAATPQNRYTYDVKSMRFHSFPRAQLPVKATTLAKTKGTRRNIATRSLANRSTKRSTKQSSFRCVLRDFVQLQTHW